MSLRETLLAFLSLAAIVNPVALAPAFAALTAGRPAAETRRIARNATLVGFALIAVGGRLGHAALRGLGAEAPLIHVAGGGALVGIGTAILFGLGGSASAMRPRRDPTFVPLAVPLVAGPGAVGAMVVLLSRHAGDARAEAELYGVLAVVGVLTWASFRAADGIARRLGPRGMGFVVRGLGLVLLVVGARFLYEGLGAYGVIGPRAR